MTAINTAGAEGTAALRGRWLCSAASQGGCLQPELARFSPSSDGSGLCRSEERGEMLSSYIMVGKGGFLMLFKCLIQNLIL